MSYVAVLTREDRGRFKHLISFLYGGFEAAKTTFMARVHPPYTGTYRIRAGGNGLRALITTLPIPRACW